MLGPTATSNGPEAAPGLSVTVIDVVLQELTVIGKEFSVTRLLPCEAPKFVPEITIWLPIEPVVADRPEITGAGVAAELTDTLSKLAVLKVVVESLASARPIYTFCAIVIVPVATWLHVIPSAEVYPLKVFPLLVTFSQHGKRTLREFGVVVLAPVLGR